MHRTPNPGVGGSSPPRPADRVEGKLMVKKVTKYFSEVSLELSKVSWPSREQLYGSVLVVVVLCVIISIFVFGIDTFLNRLITFIFK